MSTVRQFERKRLPSSNSVNATRSQFSSLFQRNDHIQSRIHAARGSGLTLDKHIQGQMERGLDANLSRIRIHTDNEADALSRSVQALAFTTGSDIFFRAGRYQPDSSRGFHLLAHEVAHVVQQAAGPVAGTPYTDGISISDPNDRFEQAAEISAASQEGHSYAKQTGHHLGQYAIFSQREHLQPASLSTLTAAQHSFPGNSNIVIQRALGAQRSLTAVSAGSVPDLPPSLVTKLTNACLSTATSTERDNVLKEIYDELKAQSIIDNVDRNDLKYGGNNAATYGITRSGSNKTLSGNYKAEVDIYSAAFDAGPAVVYSTIRHELIHAEQYRQASTTAKSATDPFFYEERGVAGQVLKGQGAENALKAVLSEIETYAWEIMHSVETGVEQAHTNRTMVPGKTQTFKEQRIGELTILYDNLIQYSGELSYEKQQKWYAYILRAKSLAERALGLTTLAQQKSIAWKPAPAQGVPAKKGKTKISTPGSTALTPQPLKKTKPKSQPRKGRKKPP